VRRILSSDTRHATPNPRQHKSKRLALLQDAKKWRERRRTRDANQLPELKANQLPQPIRNFVATLACALEHIRMDAYAADLQAACALTVTHSRRSLPHALPTGGEGTRAYWPSVAPDPSNRPLKKITKCSLNSCYREVKGKLVKHKSDKCLIYF